MNPLITGEATVEDGGVYTVVALEDLTFGINVDSADSSDADMEAES